MEYVYAAMLLHAAGKEIDEGNVTKVLKAPGLKVDEARVKALVASLDGVDIDEAIQKASVLPAAAPAGPAEAPAEKKEEKKGEKKEEKSEEEAMAGLGALFG